MTTHYAMRLIILAIALSGVSGCTTMAPAQQTLDLGLESTEPVRPAGPLPPSARPVYNLAGWPEAMKTGYIDGCETAKESSYGFKDNARYASDGQYKVGWNDGFDLCQKQNE